MILRLQPLIYYHVVALKLGLHQRFNVEGLLEAMAQALTLKAS